MSSGFVAHFTQFEGDGILDIVFSSPVTCDGLYEVVRKRIGPGELENGNTCTAFWKLAPRVKGGYVRLRKGKKDPSKIFFQIAVEQGP